MLSQTLTQEREDSYRPFAPGSIIKMLARQYIVPRETQKGRTARFVSKPDARKIEFDARLNELTEMLVEAKRAAKWSMVG